SITDRDDRRLLMVCDPFSHKGLPKSIVHVRGGASGEDQSLRFGHPAGDLDDALRRFAEAQDDFGEAAAEIPVRIELGESEVFVRQVPQGLHRLTYGHLSRFQVTKERLDALPVHGLTGSVPTSRAPGRSS